MTVIKARSLRKTFKNTIALAGIDLGWPRAASWA